MTDTTARDVCYRMVNPALDKSGHMDCAIPPGTDYMNRLGREKGVNTQAYERCLEKAMVCGVRGV